MGNLIQSQAISKEAFATFGELIDCKGATTYECNQGRAIRYHDLLKNIDVTALSGRIGLSIYKSVASPIPFDIKVMERHPLGTQAFVPMTMNPNSRYLIAVAPAGELDVSCIAAFVVNGPIGVNYKKGVWHLPIVALDHEMDFLTLDRIGPEKNCDEVVFSIGEYRIADIVSVGTPTV